MRGTRLTGKNIYLKMPGCHPAGAAGPQCKAEFGELFGPAGAAGPQRDAKLGFFSALEAPQAHSVGNSWGRALSQYLVGREINVY